MAFDGITVHCLAAELNTALEEMRLVKIQQPEKDELMLTFKGKSTQKRVLLSANPSLPLCYITEKSKQAPLTAPNFCMVLRKYLTNGRLIGVTQPGLERILRFEFEHLNEMGDLCRKVLIAELMGKHSNLIFCDEKGMVIDAIKHISSLQSSVREVLPGRQYFVPNTTGKTDPTEVTGEAFIEKVKAFPGPLMKGIYQSFTGLSPLIASELSVRAGVDPDGSVSALTTGDFAALQREFEALFLTLSSGEIAPHIYYQGAEPEAFYPLALTQYRDLSARSFDTVSGMLVQYYAEKETYTRMRQKSADLRRVTMTLIERTAKKWDIQKKQMLDTKKKEKYRLYGELLQAYAYQIPEGEKSYAALDWNTQETVTVPLDPTISVMDNAQKYFKRYGKLKRTEEALHVQLEETARENDHLQSVLTALDLAEIEADLVPIKDELIEAGYIKGHGEKKKLQQKSRPLHFQSSEGYDLFVGKNNYQNDELTFKLANGNDYWFHAKKMPGSHVILRTGGKEVSDLAFEEAAALAAYYSAGREAEKVEIDYVKRKEVKKPNGAAPGFVVYYTNYSMTIAPGIKGLTLVSE